MAEYLVELPPREMLEAKLHQAIRLARAGGWKLLYLNTQAASRAFSSSFP